MSSENDPPDDSKTRANLRGVNEALDAIKQSPTYVSVTPLIDELLGVREVVRV